MKHLLASFPLLLLTLALAACSSNHPDGQPETAQAEHGSAHEPHQHAHGQAEDSAGQPANRYMNQSEFQELVDRFEGQGRDQWQKPELVMEQLGELSGKTVADLGAGSGYFTVRLARNAEKVIAIDVDDRFVRYLIRRKLRQDLDQVEVRLAEYENPYLAPNEVDLVLTVNVYHHITNRPDYFQAIRQSLQPGGRLVVVDFKAEKTGEVGPPVAMRLPPSEVQRELTQAGFSSFELDTETLPYQYILTARP